MFQGTFEHTLDDKGRLAIPAQFRKKLAGDENGEPALVVTISDRCLAAYPLDEWTKIKTRVAALNQFDKSVIAFNRLIIGSAQECPIDKGGRILLPPDLRAKGKIEKSCVILGQLEKLEIWSAEAWAKEFPQLSDQVGAIYASLADLGF